MSPVALGLGLGVGSGETGHGSASPLTLGATSPPIGLPTGLPTGIVDDGFPGEGEALGEADGVMSISVVVRCGMA